MLTCLALVLVWTQSDGGALPEPTAPPLVQAIVEEEVAEPSSQRRFDPEYTSAEIWTYRCGMCHGREGRGNPSMGQPLGARDVTSVKWQNGRTDAQIRDAITEGLAGTKMKAFGALGSERQFDELVVLIRSMRR